MKLTLDRLDLRPEFEDISFRKSKFEHFNESAQRAIVYVGRATFQAYDRSNYNAIYAPKVSNEAPRRAEG